MIQPHAARIPVIQNPTPAPAHLPAYPVVVLKTPSEILGGQILSQYSMKPAAQERTYTIRTKFGQIFMLFRHIWTFTIGHF